VASYAFGWEREIHVVQFYPGQAYDQDLADLVIAFLQTRDPQLFPFVTDFDSSKMNAFIHDLREGLADLTDSGSARKTSASGFMMRDRRLHEIVNEWAAADGDWPRGTNAGNPTSALGSVRPTRSVN
jgi:hypothetical protein